MASFVALLRAVNVGRTGKLAMRDFEALCRDAGFGRVRTYIASGNVGFTSDAAEPELKAAMEARLLAHAGRRVNVLVRTAAEMAGVVADNPFPNAPGNRVTAIFLDGPASPAMLEAAVGRNPNEDLALGRCEIYVHHASGIATTKLRIPVAATGTARNMNTVSHLAEMAADDA
jgi:uncharacterized protein (DUF1697 family)